MNQNNTNMNAKPHWYGNVVSMMTSRGYNMNEDLTSDQVSVFAIDDAKRDDGWGAPDFILVMADKSRSFERIAKKVAKRTLVKNFANTEVKNVFPNHDVSKVSVFHVLAMDSNPQIRKKIYKYTQKIQNETGDVIEIFCEEIQM